MVNIQELPEASQPTTSNQAVVAKDVLLEDEEDQEYVDTFEENETLLQRFAALWEAFPYAWRVRLASWSAKTRATSVRCGRLLGQSVWIFTTSVFLIGFPLFLEYQTEEQVRMAEREQRLFSGADSVS